MEYKGTIIKVISQKDNWASIKVKINNGQQITAAGKIVGALEGQPIIMEGEIFIHPIYGEQINVKSSYIEPAKGENGIIAYLSSGLIKGVGNSLAKRIVNMFGDKTLTVIETEPEKLKLVNGISDKKLVSIVNSHDKNRYYSVLYNKLNGKITPLQASKIIDKYGKDSLKIIEKNPYVLIYTIDGFGFKKVDAIAKASGIAYDSPNRVGAALVFILKQISDSEGHCYATSETLSVKALDLLIETPDFLDKKTISYILRKADEWDNIKDDYAKSHKLSVSKINQVSEWLKKRNDMIDKLADAIIKESEAGRLVIDGADIYYNKIFEAETTAAKIIAEMCKMKPVKNVSDNSIKQAIHRVETSEGYALEDEQINAVTASLKSRLFVITGGPGRGKSTIIRTIIEAWNDDDTVILCAPTGKAAQRMKEITGHNAETVHHTISHPPLQSCLVVCDEASMLDIELACHLLEWARGCSLIFVGDVDQLPSVGPGSFFRNLLESKHIAAMKLVKGHRNSGAIAQNAERINEGQQLKKFIFDKSFKFISCDDSNIKDVIIKEYLRMRDLYGEKNVCILAPMKDKTGSAVSVLNEAIRNIVNPLTPSSPQLEGCKFREGDRVMQTKNMADKEVRDAYGGYSTGIYNGDCGIIIRIDEDENELLIQFDDGRIATYEKYETEDLIFAYAMTIHKSQGSEYMGVIIALTKGHNIMLRRRLLYTAATRARTEEVLVGEEEAFNDAAKNKIAFILGDLVRNTKLLQRIEENI